MYKEEVLLLNDNLIVSPERAIAYIPGFTPWDLTKFYFL